ncbi:MAG: redoxin domain-containing protein [Planctomycetes bacterium]|nr:redoxin domain-containing protein [Planctomycetota bacterium]
MAAAATVLAFGGLFVARGGSADGNGEETPAAGAAGQAEEPKAAEIDVPTNPFPNRLPAPGLEGGTGWLNTSGEITLKDLRGKVVLLDFWTYCCINCIHVLPDLEFLEEKYANQLVVIGVHSAKFDNEKDSESIRRAIQRYEIEHPVINDSEMTLWRKFGARAWPTLVLIDPEGNYCGYISGEGNREILDVVVGKLVAYHRAKGTLDETPVRFDLERDKLPPTPLRFPGKLLADEESRRLFITDSNHNRIVISSFDGQLIDVIGTGAIGAKDGGYDEATFDHPQGLALVGETLYVADTENHLIRTVDLETKTVATLAGTGEQARGRDDGGAISTTPLNSPWALLHHDGMLYVAMAGPHQIWRHAVGTQRITVYAGSGREDILDGPLKDAALAQPSGLATDGTYLYVCDSEGSAIRRISLGSRGKVDTVAGAANLPLGRTLFEFGDVDAIGERARLQHPLGIAYHDGTLYVADTYNHKIRKIDLKTRMTVTWLGDGTRGTSLDPPRFSEPAGLALADGRLFIADTNNHRVLTADIATRKVAEFTVEGLQPPAAPKADVLAGIDAAEAEEVAPQKIKAGERIAFQVHFELPQDYKLNSLFPIRYRLTAEKDQSLVPADALGNRRKVSAADGGVTVEVPLAAGTGRATLELELSFGYCREGTGGLCKIATSRWKIPVEVVSTGGSESVSLTARVKDEADGLAPQN